MSSYGKIPAAKPLVPEKTVLLKKRLDILRKMAELKKEYDQVNSQLPLEMTHSSACDQLEDNLKYLEARTPVYLKQSSRV